ncbi:putative 3-hydroxyphenylpropionic transporter MhpT [Chlamydia trachomatis]|nr:putative 3-hydroxyphenylpropionic transporter MhpT [Chlamydia trachomatis]
MNLQNNYLPGIIYNIGIFVGVSIGVVIFNHIGRKIFLTSTFLISAISIGLLALSLHANAWIKVVLFLIFAMSLSSGLVFDYTYTTELFDVKIRATGVGTCIAISRIGAFLGTFLLPIINQNYGTSTAMFICFIALVLGALICGILAIETAALSK